MSVLILCKDCGEQFNNQSSSKRLNAAIELANASSNQHCTNRLEYK